MARRVGLHGDGNRLRKKIESEPSLADAIGLVGVGLNSDEVDLISANLINERNPVAYGNDARWANHLYPVYLTERFVKSQYISDLHFLNLF